VSIVSILMNQRRPVIFVAVGAIGFVLQLTALAALMSFAHWTWLPATLVAVELAVIHNFFWHERITWRERFAGVERSPRPQTRADLERFLRFNAATGLTSILGNALLMAICVGVLGLPVLLSNAMAVGTMSAANFLLADRWVFRAVGAGAADAAGRAGERVPAPFKKRLVVALVGICICSTAASAAPSSATVVAWERYVAQTEKRLDARRNAAPPAGSRTAIPAEGESIAVEGGTISDWRGAVFIPDVTLDDLLARLQYPGTAPPQDDVLSSRVISRGPDSLHVFIRLVRHAIVTVTYDTEHEMTFTRRTPSIATARSTATRIEEVGASDRGFLWRLQSYWRYEQVDGGVRVELQSLTLSRTVPALIRPIASPIVSRIASESTVRTLEALRRYMQGQVRPVGRVGLVR
jgi:putative flippase GtrA